MPIILTNKTLCQELEKRILTQQIVLEIKQIPVENKECGLDIWKSVIQLQVRDYTLDLVKLFNQLEDKKFSERHQQESQQHCHCHKCQMDKEAFSFFTKIFQQFNSKKQSK